MLGLRPPGLEFRILCLEGSVISIISPSSGGSPGPVWPICAQRWPKARFISFSFYFKFKPLPDISNLRFIVEVGLQNISLNDIQQTNIKLGTVNAPYIHTSLDFLTTMITTSLWDN